MKQLFFSAVGLLSTTLLLAQAPKVNPDKYGKMVSADLLKKELYIIAGAEMEGRETATPGQKKAAAYIENHFKQHGLLPGAGKGSYQQFYPLYQDSIGKTSLQVYQFNFGFDEHYSVAPNLGAAGNWQINELVYAGFGIKDNEKNDYANLPIQGNWVMILDATPADIDKPAAPMQGMRVVGNTGLQNKINYLRTNGAKGIIVVSKDFPKGLATPQKGNMSMNKPTTATVPVIQVSYQVASSMLNKVVDNYAGLKNVSAGKYSTSVKTSIDKTTLQLESSNVIGIIEGTDKKDEYLVITSHYDHLGKRGNDIYYGADDDGSGTVSVMELARVFAQAKAKGHGPRRTIVFMTVSGEEKGLWGSAYYGNNPIFPLNKTTANLNIDMVGRIDPSYKGDSNNYVFVIGEDKLSSDLQPISDAVNSKYVKMELDRRYNDPKDPNRFYYRSDHYNFAAKGVPIIFYFNGVHKDYHRTTDTPDKINYPLMQKRVHLVFHTAWEMANRDDMLKRDMPLNMPAR